MRHKFYQASQTKYAKRAQHCWIYWQIILTECPNCHLHPANSDNQTIKDIPTIHEASQWMQRDQLYEQLDSKND
jgi:hypothetical protein